MTANTNHKKLRISVSWVELPAYGARLVKAGIDKYAYPVDVVATTPQIPIKGMDEILKQKIHWIDKSGVTSWAQLGLPVPDIFFQAGWYIPSFINLGDEVRRNGGRVVLLADNCWKNSVRQWLGTVKFRLQYRRKFSAVWVPGKSGQKLMRILGMPLSRVYQGLYGSNPDCFTPGPTLASRPEQFVFVGKLTPAKGIPTLVKAFDTFHRLFPQWRVLIYGDGQCRNLLTDKPGIVVHPFTQPQHIAESLRQSRFLVLPTLTDNWPLVVSEAAMSGCGLILSDRAGNIPEFVTNKNGFLFKPGNAKQLADKLAAAASLSGPRLNEVYEESKRLGAVYVPDHWANQFTRIISEVGQDLPRFK